MELQLWSSPLQGFTEFRFRNAFVQCFGGIDLFYAPYIRLKGKAEIKKSYQRDLDPENNLGVRLIPQVMASDAESFLYVAEYVKSLGYDELNWNLGCPYPMVTKRKMGAGLIAYPQQIEEVLNTVFATSDIKVSVKMRLGNEGNEEIFQALDVLNQHPIRNITIHPRTAMQLYKGNADPEAFAACLQRTDHPVQYNGDVFSYAAYAALQERFPELHTWVLGRGILRNPFLAQQIRMQSDELPVDWVEQFQKFHDLLLSDYADALSGAQHLILKMYQFWEYFIHLFPDAGKALKKVRKARTMTAYDLAVNDLLRTVS